MQRIFNRFRIRTDNVRAVFSYQQLVASLQYQMIDVQVTRSIFS